MDISKVYDLVSESLSMLYNVKDIMNEEQVDQITQLNKAIDNIERIYIELKKEVAL